MNINMHGEEEIRGIVFDPKLNHFIEKSITQSLSDIGYPHKLVEKLFAAIDGLGCEAYAAENAEELYQLQTVHFLGELAGKLFEKYVIPEIPGGGKIFDIGCGTGTLLKELVGRNDGELVGIDINAYPAWEGLRGLGIRTVEVPEKEFARFLEKELPDSVVMTWVLHHMDYAEQEEYLEIIHHVLKPGSRVVVLEDAYSEKLPPETGKNLSDDFMVLGKEDRKRAMSAFDWIANRVLAGRRDIPMPFGFRTLEEWDALFGRMGFKMIKERFLGFPADRDVNNGQSLLVVAKP